MSEGIHARVDLTEKHFDRISRILYDTSGIQLRHGKEELVHSRLARRLRQLGLDGFDSYLEKVEQDGSGRELTLMVDLLTTNKTSFFREKAHFDFLREQMLPELLRRSRSLRIWSAGCSSGEEPYTLAMLLRDAVSDIDRRDVRILATDISDTVLATARNAVYSEMAVNGLPDPKMRRFFVRTRTERGPALQVADTVRKLVSFARLNLMADWPIRGPFDAIFCRNVMIYFDRPTQLQLAGRFASLLPPGGILFIGHSESLTNSSEDLQYVMPAVYSKPGSDLSFAQSRNRKRRRTA